MAAEDKTAKAKKEEEGTSDSWWSYVPVGLIAGGAATWAALPYNVMMQEFTLGFISTICANPYAVAVGVAVWVGIDAHGDGSYCRGAYNRVYNGFFNRRDGCQNGGPVAENVTDSFRNQLSRGAGNDARIRTPFQRSSVAAAQV